jgi:hypothetical protein
MSAPVSDWRTFFKRHGAAFSIFVITAALACAWGVYIFLWFVSNAQSTGLVPSSLGLWTIGNLVVFILYAIFWELVLVGIPVAVAAVVAWLWWRRLPYEERIGYRMGGRSRSAGGSGGVPLLFFIAFCIKVYVDGNWNVAISTFSVNYVVSSMLTILIWGLIIVGIPAAIAMAWWVRREMRRP